VTRGWASCSLLFFLLAFSTRLDGNPAARTEPPQIADSLGIIPRPLAGLEGSAIRWGMELTCTRVFLPLESVSPWLEAGIRYFERLDTYPDDKKAFLLRAGVLVPFGDVHLAPGLGLVSGGGQASLELTFGLWRFFGVTARPRPRLEDYPDYGTWLDADRTWERARTEETPTALGFGLSLTPWLAPQAVLSFSIAVFL